MDLGTRVHLQAKNVPPAFPYVDDAVRLARGQEGTALDISPSQAAEPYGRLVLNAHFVRLESGGRGRGNLVKIW
jgi:hypothetical protein